MQRGIILYLHGVHPNVHTHSHTRLLALSSPPLAAKTAGSHVTVKGVVLPASCHYNRWSGVDSSASFHQQPRSTHTSFLICLQTTCFSSPISSTCPGIDQQVHMCVVRHKNTYMCEHVTVKKSNEAGRGHSCSPVPWPNKQITSCCKMYMTIRQGLTIHFVEVRRSVHLHTDG